MTPEDTNPFLDALSGAGKYAGNFLVNLPGRALQLPGRILNEVLQTPGAVGGRRAQSMQSDLRRQVTGEDIPFRPGLNTIHNLTLGLIPGQESASIQRDQLTTAQQAEFDKLQPVMQALLQSRTPQDFADVMSNDALFAEPGAPDVKFGKPGDVAYVNGQPVSRVPEKSVPLGKDQRLVDPETGSELVGAMQEKPKSLLDRTKPDALFKEYTAESMQRAYAANDASLLELRPDLGAEQAAKSAGKSFENAGKLRDDYNQIVGNFEKLGDKFRGFLGVFAVDQNGAFATGLNSIQPEVMSGLEATVDALREQGAPVTALKDRNANALRDISMIFMFLKILDPESTVREGEKDFIQKARSIFSQEILDNVFSGRALTNDQRVQMLEAMRDTFASKYGGYDNALSLYRNIAVRNGLDPRDAAPDYLSDIRAALFGTGADSAAMIPADTDSAKAIGDMYIKDGGDPNDDQAIDAYFMKLGFAPPPSG